MTIPGLPPSSDSSTRSTSSANRSRYGQISNREIHCGTISPEASRNGTRMICALRPVLCPLSLLCRLAALVPPPRCHLVHYAGVLAPASKWRPLIVPPAPEQPEQDSTATSAQRPPTHRSHYRPWAELLKRTFACDVEKCPRCGGRLKLRALVTRPASIRRYLRYLGEPTEAPPLAPARDPPYFKSRALRRKLGDLDGPPAQGDLFGA